MILKSKNRKTMKPLLYSLIVILNYVRPFACQNTLTKPDKCIASYYAPVIPHDHHTGSPFANCTYQVDPVFKGTLVDCRSRNIYRITTDWMPANTTTALFGSNHIWDLPSNLSTVVPNLVVLSLSDNHLTSSSQLKALSRLVKLQILDLESNCLNLDRRAWKEPFFENMTDLKDLKLGHNNLGKGNYPDFLLKGLTNLQHLNLDTFIGTMEFGSIFDHTPKLRTLILCGKSLHISNETFLSLDKVPLEELYLFNLQNFLQLDKKAFVYLRSLHTLKVQLVRIGINLLLDSLSPFQGRKFRNIEFICTSYLGHAFTNFSQLDDNSGRFLNNICLERLILVHNKVIFLSRRFITLSPLSHCLKHLIIRTNPLRGDVVAFFRILSMFNLETIEVSDIKYSIFNQKLALYRGCIHAQTSLPQRGIMSLPPKNSIFGGDPNREKHGSGKSVLRLRDAVTHTLTKTTGRERNKDDNHKPCGKVPKNIIIFLKPNLTAIRFNGMENYLTKIDTDLCFQSNNNLKEIIGYDNGLKLLSGRLIGLHHLEILDISSSNASQIQLDFFDYLPTLRHLNISNFNLNPVLMATKSQRLFRSLEQLLTLDISYNHLIELSPNTFDTLDNLNILNLAGNSFKDLPIDLNILPKLQTLDLSVNSIEILSDSSTMALDQQVTSHGHSLNLILSGNIISCRCDSLKFLAWTRRTLVKLDNDGNYTCMDEEGRLRFTASVGNLEAKWRRCNGWTSLMISLFLACLITLAYISVFLCMKFKTRFAAFFLEMAHKIHGPENYAVDVFIGYADSDAAVVRFLVTEFIETFLGFTTYVRHRDLDPGKTMVDSIVHAIQSSWRVLILVSHDFLTNDEWAWFTMQAAIFSVENANPRRVIVLVEEQMRNRIPHCLLTAVHEENIITIENRLRMTYDERLRLRYSLQ